MGDMRRGEEGGDSESSVKLEAGERSVDAVDRPFLECLLSALRAGRSLAIGIVDDWDGVGLGSFAGTISHLLIAAVRRAEDREC